MEIHYTDIGVVGNMSTTKVHRNWQVLPSQHLPILKIRSCPCEGTPNGCHRFCYPPSCSGGQFFFSFFK